MECADLTALWIIRVSNRLSNSPGDCTLKAFDITARARRAARRPGTPRYPRRISDETIVTQGVALGYYVSRRRREVHSAVTLISLKGQQNVYDNFPY